MAATQTVLVADDDTAMREVMRLALTKEGFAVTAVESSARAFDAVRQQRFDVIVTDIYLGDGTGLELLEHCRTHCPEAKVILVTAHGTIETATSAQRLGVFDYLAKPFAVETLVDRVRTAVRRPVIGQPATAVGPQSMIIGNHPAIVEVYNAVAKVAPLAIPVLVRGETGTGKELIARALHRFGANPDRPFVPLNCGAIPDTLLESELFGHRKGAFTGADRDHQGAVETARDGTLFLDEIGELPLAMQVKLFRFLQSGEVRSVGSSTPITVPVRVVAATNRDLRSDVENGTFREDFYYRLAPYEIHLPPLRERSSDIPVLVEHFRHQHTKRLGLQDIAPSTDVLEALENHPWPGNVRELEHLVQRALVDAGSLTDRRHVCSLIERATTTTASPEISPSIGDDLTLEEIERMHILAVLRRCGGNRTRTAEVLGIGRKSLYRKADRLGIALDARKNT